MFVGYPTSKKTLPGVVCEEYVVNFSSLSCCIICQKVLLAETTLEISNLAAGMYFVRVENVSGIAERKLIIQ